MPSVTSSAPARITVAIIGPNDFSPPTARTGIFSRPRGQERAVVDRVLVEGRELREAGMHRAGQRVELRVVPPRRFAEAIGRGRELVPEAVEVDALAAGDEPLHVGPAEAEVPEQRVLQDLFPRPDAGHRRVDQHQPPHPLGIAAPRTGTPPCCRCRAPPRRPAARRARRARRRRRSAWVFLSKPPVGLDDRPSPRRSGTITVWSRARSAASGTHMSPVSP